MDKNAFRSICRMAVMSAKKLSEQDALDVQELYPEWRGFIGKELTPDKNPYVQHEGRFYKVNQKVPEVLENQPPGVETAALYTEINKTNAGTKEDPIPYNNNMILYAGKYYSQYGVVYRCTRDTDVAVFNNLSELVGIYVEVEK